MDKSLNPFAPIVHDDRAARALILDASKQISEFVRVHDEAAASQDHEAKERANVQRVELKKVFEKLQGFVPDAEKPIKLSDPNPPYSIYLKKINRIINCTCSVVVVCLPMIYPLAGVLAPPPPFFLTSFLYLLSH